MIVESKQGVMKKLSIIFVLLFLIASSSLIFVLSIGEPYIIDGNKVYIDDSKVYISAEPHTIQSSGWVVFNITSKVYTGDVDVTLGFNTTYHKPTAIERYNPTNESRIMNYTCETDYFNYTLSPKYAWCYDYVNTYDEHGNENGTELITIFEHPFDSGNIPTKTIFWNETYIDEWKPLNLDFSSVDYAYDGMNKWWYSQNIPIVKGQEYVFRVFIKNQKPSFSEPKRKYDFAIKPSGETIPEAIANGHFYMLDPFTEGLVNGLVAGYSFDHPDDNDTFVVDVYRGKYNLTQFSNTPVHTASCGVNGSCMDYDVTDRNFDTYAISELGSGEVTVCAWVKANADSGDQRIFSVDTADDDIVMYRNDNTYFQHFLGGAQRYLSRARTNGQWYFQCGVAKNLGVSDLWLDGVNETSASQVGTADLDAGLTGSGTLMISKDTEGMNGYIDEVYIWNRTLSEAEILDLNSSISCGASCESVGGASDITPPYFTQISNQTLYSNQSLNYDINATDETAFDSFSIDDTTNFTINSSSGVITNTTALGVYYYQVNVTINDTSNNLNSTLWSLNVSATPNPTIDLNLIYPTTNINATQNEFFNVTVNVTCRNANCGEINVSLDPELSSVSGTNEWTMFGRQLTNTRWDGVKFDRVGVTQETFDLTNDVYSAPAVANGYVYIGGFDTDLHQLNASNISQEIATFNTGSVIFASSAVANGYVYIGSYDNILYQLNASNVSQQIANFTAGSIFGATTNPSVTSDYVYVGNSDKQFYQLNASNVSQLIANFSTGDFIVPSSAVANGYVYIGSDDNILYQLNASNVSQQIANFTTTGELSSSPAISGGYLYFGDEGQDVFYQLNASNVSQQIANLTLDGTNSQFHSSPAVANGYVYVGAFNSILYQLNASNVSKIVNSINVSDRIAYSSPIIYKGCVFIGAYDNNFHQVRADNVSVYIKNYSTSGDIYHAGAIANDYAYVPSWDNKLYQFKLTDLLKDGLISTNTGDIPFYTNESNPRNISLSKDESQLVTFWVNATGTISNSYTFFAYANITSDMTISNITNTWNVTIISGAVADTTPPYFTTIPADDSVTYPQEWTGVDFEATDESSFDSYVSNDSRFTINSTGWLDNAGGLSVGVYHINITINDTSNNLNSTIFTFTINQNSSLVLTQTYTSPIEYPTTTDFTGVGCPSELTCSLNLTNGIFKAGTIYSNYSTTGNENYTSTSNISAIVINQNSSLILGISGTSPITYGTTTDVAGSDCPSELTCSLDKANAVYGVGTETFNYSTAGNENYTSSSITTDITINKADSSLGMNISGSGTITYPQISNFSSSENNTGDAGCSYSMDLTNAVYGVGTTTFNYSTSGCANYTSGSITKNLTVNQNTTFGLGLTATTPITYGTTTDFTGSDCPAELSCSLNISNAVYGAGKVSANYSTAGNENYTSNSTTFEVTINQANLTASLSSSNGWNINYSQGTTISVSESNTGDADVNYSVYRDGTLVGVGAINLSVGTYEYFLNTTGGANYTSNASMDNKTLTINQLSSSVNLTLGEQNSNRTIVANNTLDLNCSAVGEGIIKLYNNGTLINSGTSPIGNTTNFTEIFLYNITCVYEATTNYTGSSQTYYVNVTQPDTIAPVLSILYPLATSYSTTVTTLKFSATDNVETDRCWYSTNGGSTNSSTNNCASNFTGLSAVVGSNTWTLFANDTSGNLNSTSVTFTRTDGGGGGGGGGGGSSGSSTTILLNNLTLEYSKWIRNETNYIYAYTRDINGSLVDVDAVEFDLKESFKFTLNYSRVGTGKYRGIFLIDDDVDAVTILITARDDGKVIEEEELITLEEPTILDEVKLKSRNFYVRVNDLFNSPYSFMFGGVILVVLLVAIIVYKYDKKKK